MPKKPTKPAKRRKSKKKKLRANAMQQPGVCDINHFVGDSIDSFGKFQRPCAIPSPYAWMDVVAHFADFMRVARERRAFAGPSDALGRKPAQFVGDTDELVERKFQGPIPLATEMLPGIDGGPLDFLSVQETHRLQARLE